jgi:hypothetical protein
LFWVLGSVLGKRWQNFALASPEDPSPQNPDACGSPREWNLVRTLFPGCLYEVMLLQGQGMAHLYPNEREKNGV